mmetsp:Transcript_34764/g.85093  ORF Transcript_34764/g.85093 Transcript_34764/m.85093 type:complete len:220 (-) Transcript_34764:146-805(-)
MQISHRPKTHSLSANSTRSPQRTTSSSSSPALPPTRIPPSESTSSATTRRATPSATALSSFLMQKLASSPITRWTIPSSTIAAFASIFPKASLGYGAIFAGESTLPCLDMAARQPRLSKDRLPRRLATIWSLMSATCAKWPLDADAATSVYWSAQAAIWSTITTSQHMMCYRLRHNYYCEYEKSTPLPGHTFKSKVSTRKPVSTEGFPFTGSNCMISTN